MIRTVRHRGLKRLIQRGDPSGISAAQHLRVENIVTLLNVATKPGDLDIPGYKLHPLKGEFKGYWSVAVGANWRIIFRIEDGDVYDVDFMDYH